MKKKIFLLLAVSLLCACLVLTLAACDKGAPSGGEPSSEDGNGKENQTQPGDTGDAGDSGNGETGDNSGETGNPEKPDDTGGDIFPGGTELPVIPIS